MPEITKLLIANRGEIARRIIRTAHRMGIATVAVHSDVDANALHVREATQSHALEGNASADTYLRIDKLIAAARATGADSIHPGYGFLSENADFAQAVIDAGLVWVGPPPAAIRALGSKSAAKQLAQQHGVPVLPGYYGDDQSDERLLAEAQRIGVPLMVKAAAGGGGRGMRLVTDLTHFAEAARSARSEALNAFGSGELLIERALLRPRHVEVQVFADMHGHCVHLGERDCSVQRRHQKIIEETPSPAVDAALRERMGACAVALARAAGYVGAGTVEFLVDEPSFHLMEMNTRLQVEHPVTEMVTGLDLVEWQLRVARGEPLPLSADELKFEGHAIEVRLCAEDEQFHPHTGRVLAFVPPALGDGLRFDHAIEQGTEVSAHYDSMLGKLIAHAATREQAIARLVAGLSQLVLLGLHVNRGLLIECLQDAGFRAGAALIPFLSEQGDALRDRWQQRRQQAVAQWGAQACLVAQRQGLPRHAVRLPPPFDRPLRFAHAGQVHQVLTANASDAMSEPLQVVRLAAPGMLACQLHAQRDGVDAWIDDLSYTPPASAQGGSAGAQLRAPFNGRVLSIKVAPGEAVCKGQSLLVLESMKLEHAISAPRDGVVAQIHVQADQQATPGMLLVTLEDEHGPR